MTDPVGHVIFSRMARDPSVRLAELVKCATRVFIDQGYQRTQMEDIAALMGVAKGTLYVYVESKEALFDLVLRCADVERPFEQIPSLPIATPKPGATLTYVRQRLIENQEMPALTAALARKRAMPARVELEGIIHELYDTVERNRQGLKLLDSSAKDHPELAALWFEGARGGLVAMLTEYLERHIRRGALRGVTDIPVAARLILETVVFWAVHRHWDPHPQVVRDASARETVIKFLADAMLKE